MFGDPITRCLPRLFWRLSGGVTLGWFVASWALAALAHVGAPVRRGVLLGFPVGWAVGALGCWLAARREPDRLEAWRRLFLAAIRRNPGRALFDLGAIVLFLGCCWSVSPLWGVGVGYPARLLSLFWPLAAASIAVGFLGAAARRKARR